MKDIDAMALPAGSWRPSCRPPRAAEPGASSSRWAAITPPQWPSTWGSAFVRSAFATAITSTGNGGTTPSCWRSGSDRGGSPPRIAAAHRLTYKGLGSEQESRAKLATHGRLARSLAHTHRAIVRAKGTATDGAAPGHRQGPLRRQGSSRRRRGLSAVEQRGSPHLAFDRLPHHQAFRGQWFPGAAQLWGWPRSLRGDSAPPSRPSDRYRKRPGDRVSQRGDRTPAGAGGARFGL